MDEYFNFVMLLFLYMFILFQLPIVLSLSIIFQILNINTILYVRKYMFLIALIIGALISPPDVISQILFAIPLYFLYESSIFLILLLDHYI
jgi:sec-independent protein translocase protein TatC